MRCLLATFCLGLPLFTAAQTRPPAALSGFDLGYTGIGPTIGLGGGIGGASIAFGGRFEKGVKALPDMGNGILGIGLLADYYNYSDRTFGSDVSFSYVLLGGTTNLHFKVDSKRWDPFVGVGLGYAIESVSGAGTTVTGKSGLFFIGHGGIRYFSSDRTAIQVDLGTGTAMMNVGLMWRL